MPNNLLISQQLGLRRPASHPRPAWEPPEALISAGVRWPVTAGDSRAHTMAQVARWLASQVFKKVANWGEGEGGSESDDETIYLQCGKVRVRGGCGAGPPPGPRAVLRGSLRCGMALGSQKPRAFAPRLPPQSPACRSARASHASPPRPARSSALTTSRPTCARSSGSRSCTAAPARARRLPRCMSQCWTRCGGAAPELSRRAAGGGGCGCTVAPRTRLGAGLLRCWRSASVADAAAVAKCEELGCVWHAGGHGAQPGRPCRD